MKCLKMNKGPIRVLVSEDNVKMVEERLKDGYSVMKNKYGQPIFVDSKDIKSSSDSYSLNELLKT